MFSSKFTIACNLLVDVNSSLTLPVRGCKQQQQPARARSASCNPTVARQHSMCLLFPLYISHIYIRVVHGSDGPAGRVGSGRVGSGRVTILPDFGGSGRVGSALRIFKFSTDYFLVPESI